MVIYVEVRDLIQYKHLSYTVDLVIDENTIMCSNGYGNTITIDVNDIQLGLINTIKDRITIKAKK
jgi:hypothetical protein